MTRRTLSFRFRFLAPTALAASLVVATGVASAQSTPAAPAAQSTPAAPAPAPAAQSGAQPAPAQAGAGDPAQATPTNEKDAKSESASSTPGVKERGESLDSLGAHAVTWDANLEGGFGRAFGDIHARTVSFGRLRGGILWVHGQWFTSVGAFYDLSNFTPGTFGIQVEQMHLTSGFWIQAGGGIDVEPRAMGMLSVGWSVIGVEAQYRSYGDAGIGPAVFGKLRIPIGVIGFALANRK
ncbi:hypothetical protein [Pendulispora albinea]|uniref:Uncharacterized protein n=1 Tax=Pendulispora albinea TaxID=2741071 RepID=A0ABZ2LTI9_9BACT